MNKKDLKILIKELVRQSLVEIFVEMKLENIVENVISKQKNTITENNNYSLQNNEKQENFISKKQENKKELREQLMKKMKVDSNEWAGIYGDIDIDNLPPAGAEISNENPEFVNESDLRKLGLL